MHPRNKQGARSFPFTITSGYFIYHILGCPGSVLSYDCTSDCRSLSPMWLHTSNSSCLFSDPPTPTPSSFQTSLTCPSVTSRHGPVEYFRLPEVSGFQRFNWPEQTNCLRVKQDGHSTTWFVFSLPPKTDFPHEACIQIIR